jgi:hypothetical protein
MISIHNKLTITGGPRRLDQIRDLLGRSTLTIRHIPVIENSDNVDFVTVNEPVFALSNINFPDGAMKTECSLSWRTTMLWNKSSWGNSEEATNASIVLDEPGELVYRFRTVDAAPTIALLKLSRDFPHHEFALDATYPDGNGRGSVYKGGYYVKDGTWGAPTTHRRFEIIRGPGTCRCRGQYIVSPNHPYFDCPGQDLTTTQAVSEMDIQSETLVQLDQIHRKNSNAG